MVAKRKSPNTQSRESYDEIEAGRSVARALYVLRQSKGLTQAALAKKMGTSQAAVSRAERADYRGHSWKVIFRYAYALGAFPVLRFAPIATVDGLGAKRKKPAR